MKSLDVPRRAPKAPCRIDSPGSYGPVSHRPPYGPVSHRPPRLLRPRSHRPPGPAFRSHGPGRRDRADEARPRRLPCTRLRQHAARPCGFSIDPLGRGTRTFSAGSCSLRRGGWLQPVWGPGPSGTHIQNLNSCPGPGWTQMMCAHVRICPRISGRPGKTSRAVRHTNSLCKRLGREMCGQPSRPGHKLAWTNVAQECQGH